MRIVHYCAGLCVCVGYGCLTRPQGTDGRFYVIDLARVFPPAAEPTVRQTYLYRLLRPEFVKTYHCPLSSDAFSNFGGADNVGEGHDKEVQEATDTLLNAKIPAFAAWLDQQAFKNGTSGLSISMTYGCVYGNRHTSRRIDPR